MEAGFDLGQPFSPRQKKPGSLGWEESRLSRYDIHDEVTPPPSITDNESKHFLVWINSLKRINSKLKYLRLELFEGDCSANFEWVFPKQ